MSFERIIRITKWILKNRDSRHITNQFIRTAPEIISISGSVLLLLFSKSPLYLGRIQDEIIKRNSCDRTVTADRCGCRVWSSRKGNRHAVKIIIGSDILVDLGAAVILHISVALTCTRYAFAIHRQRVRRIRRKPGYRLLYVVARVQELNAVTAVVCSPPVGTAGTTEFYSFITAVTSAADKARL
ncbi:hypothetical protein QFZ81_001409 [Paenibacillus sp. V4I9]|nr:hypothetical protein [Paenibacillus sp. V4I9]